jgi:hypothetical protein
MNNESLRRELIIAATLFAVGFFFLPFAIFWVGQRVVGDYAPDAGVWDLAEHIWSDLLFLQPTAWIVVLSPYVVVLLARLVRRLWRAKPL